MESGTPQPRRDHGRRAGARLPAGWTPFAGLMLLIVGSLAAMWGLGAILNDDVGLGPRGPHALAAAQDHPRVAAGPPYSRATAFLTL